MLGKARALFCLLLVLAPAGCGRKATPDPILVGYLAAPTGSEKGSEQARRGLSLAVQEFNTSDDLISGRTITVLAPHVESGTEALQHTAARLVSVNRVTALLGGTTFAETDALGKAGQSAGAPVVALAALPARELSENVYPAQLALPDQGQLLARYAVAELQADRAVLLHEPGEANQLLADAFTRQFARDDAKRRTELFRITAETPAAELVERVREAKPKVVLIAGTAAEFLRWRTALRQAGVDVPLLFAGAAKEQVDLAAQREASDGVCMALLAGADGTLTREFAARFRKEHGQEPDEQAQLAYDAAQVLFAAMRRARGGTRDRLREELAQVLVGQLKEGKLRGAKSYKLPGK